MNRTTTVPFPRVAIPPQVRQTATHGVAMPTPIVVPKPTVPMPQRTNTVTVTTPEQPVPTPKVATPVVAQPVQTPRVTVPVFQPQTTQRTTGQQQGGGMLKHFGGDVTTVTRTPQMTTAPVIHVAAETGYSILTKLLPVWGGSDEQAKQLASLRYVDETPIISPDRRDIIREVIGMLIYQDFEEVVDFLTDAPNPEFILWDQESMDEGKNKVIREIAIQQAEEVGVKGVGRCRYCPSTELVYASKQLRSGDEAATIFVRCVLCQKQWRQ